MRCERKDRSRKAYLLTLTDTEELRRVIWLQIKLCEEFCRGTKYFQHNGRSRYIEIHSRKVGQETSVNNLRCIGEKVDEQFDVHWETEVTCNNLET